MKNGECPHTDRHLVKRLKAIEALLLELASDIDLTKQASMMIFGSVIDLSNRTGPQKSEHNKKVLKAIWQLHQKSWRQRRKQLLSHL